MRKKRQRKKPSYIIEPELKGSGNRSGIKSFIITGAIIITIIALGLLIKNYYFSPIADQTDDALSTIKTPDDLLKDEVEAKGKVDKPKDNIDKAFNDLNADKKSLKVKTKEQIKKEEAQEEAIKANIIKNAQSNPSKALNYHIVAGSFKNADLADKFLKSLKRSGYKATIVIQTIRNEYCCNWFV